MPAAYPVRADLSNLLTDAGLTAPSSATLDACLAAAVKWWDGSTGYDPFLAVDSVAHSFDPPGSNTGPYAIRKGGSNIVRLDNGLVTFALLRVGGVTKTLNTDYFLRPANAARAGKPYEWVEFVYPVYGASNSIVITATWGYSESVPDDVWNAVLKYAGWQVTQVAMAKLTGGSSGYTIGSQISETFNTEPFKATAAGWMAEANLVVGSYKRVVAYL